MEHSTARLLTTVRLGAQHGARYVHFPHDESPEMWGAYVWAARENSRSVGLEFGGFSTGPVGGLGVGVDVRHRDGIGSRVASTLPASARIATAGVLVSVPRRCRRFSSEATMHRSRRKPNEATTAAARRFPTSQPARWTRPPVDS